MKNNITLKEIKNSITADLFTPSLPKSLSYLLIDISALFFLFILLNKSIEEELFTLLPFLSIIIGNIFFALFVIGHDCGHGSFSKSKKFNNMIGFLTHQFLLTPYWSWKKSHFKHHRYSGNLNKDESIVPFNESEAKHSLKISPQKKVSLLKVRVFNLFIFLTGINFHLYTIYNPRTKASHFLPNKVFLTPKDSFWIYLGTLSVFLWISFLVFFAKVNTTLFIFFYLLPIIICYHLMGLVTLMQHHHPDSKWFYDSNWSFIDGALNTFDYRYGFFDKTIIFFHHSIAHFHTVHHLFASIPHYNLGKATKELKSKKVVPIKTKNFSYKSYFKIIWNCNFVNDEQHPNKFYSLKPFEEMS